MPEVEVEVTSSMEYHTLAASCGACHSEGTMVNQAIESGQRRVVQFVMLLVPSTPKASTPKASSPKASSPKASTPKASTPKALRGATSAQLPHVLAQCAAARWRLTGTARRAAPVAAWLGLSTCNGAPACRLRRSAISLFCCAVDGKVAKRAYLLLLQPLLRAARMESVQAWQRAHLVSTANVL